MLVAIYVVSAVLSPLLHPGREQGLTPTGWQPAHAGAFAANFLVVVLVAPVVEELTFRGIGYTLLARFGAWPAILLTGLAFGLAHGLVDGLPLLVLFGCLLAWLRTRTDSIYPGMLVHGTFNAIALIAAVTHRRGLMRRPLARAPDRAPRRRRLDRVRRALAPRRRQARRLARPERERRRGRDLEARLPPLPLAGAATSSGLSRRARVPPIDFARDEVLLAAIGARSSTGYGVHIESISDERSRIVVRVRETTPSLGEHVQARVTYPYVLATIPRSDKRVHFVWLGRP